MNSLSAVVAKASAAGASSHEPPESSRLPAIHKKSASTTSSLLPEAEIQPKAQPSGNSLQRQPTAHHPTVEYLVVHNYEASHEDELSVEVGEVVRRYVEAMGEVALTDVEVDEEGWLRVENARGDVGLVPEVILEKEAMENLDEEEVMSSDGEDQSVEALQRRKNRRVAAYEQEKLALQHQMTAIRNQAKQKRIDKAKASKRERARIQREFRAKRAAEKQAQSRSHQARSSRTALQGRVKGKRRKKKVPPPKKAVKDQAPTHGALAESALGDGAKALADLGTTVEEQLALQNLQSMQYAEGTPEYDINLSRHEVRTLSHPDVVYEKSLLIRQRLLNYKGS